MRALNRTNDLVIGSGPITLGLQDTSFLAFPTPDHAFFKQEVLKGQLSDNQYQFTRLPAQVINFRRPRLTCCGASQPPLASFKKLFRPQAV